MTNVGIHQGVYSSFVLVFGLCTATSAANYKRRRQIECIGVNNIRHGLVDTHAQPEHRKGQ